MEYESARPLDEQLREITKRGVAKKADEYDPIADWVASAAEKAAMISGAVTMLLASYGQER